MKKKKDDTFKNIGYSVTYEENAKREKVKSFFESINKKPLIEKDFEMLLIDTVLADIDKDNSTKSKP